VNFARKPPGPVAAPPEWGAAAADREDGHVTLERGGEERELGVVALRPGAERGRMRLRAVEIGVDIGAPGEEQPVEPVECLLDPALARRHEQRPATRPRAPPGCTEASDVGSWTRTVTSPRSTVTRLVAPRNAVAITVPTIGPPAAAPSGVIDMGSGRTRAIAGPSGALGCTSGRRVPRTSTVPPWTNPGKRLVRPTNSVAGRS